jgi:hypothetical protein
MKTRNTVTDMLTVTAWDKAEDKLTRTMTTGTIARMICIVLLMSHTVKHSATDTIRDIEMIDDIVRCIAPLLATLSSSSSIHQYL